MLWMKAWLETRWRLLYSLAIPAVALALPWVMGGGVHSAKEAQTMIGRDGSSFACFSQFFWLGQAFGRKRPFAAMKGLEGSKYFTLVATGQPFQVDGSEGRRGPWGVGLGERDRDGAAPGFCSGAFLGTRRRWTCSNLCSLRSPAPRVFISCRSYSQHSWTMFGRFSEAGL